MDPIEKARGRLLAVGKIGPKLGIAHAALDYIDALEAWLDWLGIPSDAEKYVEIRRKFEETICQD